MNNMSINSFSKKFLIAENTSSDLEINALLGMSIDERVAFVNVLFFMDNRTQEVLYKNEIGIKVIRTKKLDLGFLMITNYNGAVEKNEAVIEFLNANKSYWSVQDERIKLNTNLILDHRKADIDRLLRYFEVKKGDLLY